ncbi:MAG: polyprenyl synthetase family protein [Deltaproteobacteria bacterium]|nr:polyprenyl synthetase family protein [Deltaproteobacteria bacterium]
MRNAARLVTDSLPPELRADRDAVEESLRAVRTIHATRLGTAARHLLEAGGKRLRPLLTCAAARTLGADPRPRAALVAAVELVHVGSLLHDDVIDAGAVRRGRPAVHAAYDAHTAILAGDLLFAWAFDRLARDGSRELQIALGDAIRALCEGEVLERERRRDPTVEVEHVRRVNRLKTAALFGYAAEAAALLADAPTATRAALREYGLALGEAFQAADDLLDWEGRPESLGKPLCRDLAEGLVNLPVALGADRDGALRDAVRACWGASDDDAAAARRFALRAALREAGAFEATRELAREDARRAVAALHPLPAGPWRDWLAAAAAASVERDG